MGVELRLFLAAVVLFYIVIVLRLLILQKLTVRYSLLWLFTAVLLLILFVFPQLLDWLAGITNVVVTANLLFLVSIVFLLMLTLHVTCTISAMNQRIVRDTQFIALMEKRIRELEEKQAQIEEAQRLSIV